MKMRSKTLGLIGTICVALSASADRAHDLFETNRDVILAQPITVCGEVAFSVGRACSPRNRGDAVGYAKAAEAAKWNLGERNRTTAPWPRDILDSEKEAAWLEYRSQHSERFSVVGMQRIRTKKTPPDNYMVVLSFPADQVNVPGPTTAELKAALEKVRDRKREAEEERARMARAASEVDSQDVGSAFDDEVSEGINASTGESQTISIKKRNMFNEDLML